jgi:hypothetical protein
MAWYLDTVRIFPQASNKSWEQISAELNPLGGGSIIHNFGHSEEKRNVNAYIVGIADEAALAAMTISGIFYTLSGPYGVQDYLVKSVTSDQVPFVNCQSLRPDLDEDAPVFIVDLELWLDE